MGRTHRVRGIGIVAVGLAWLLTCPAARAKDEATPHTPRAWAGAWQYAEDRTAPEHGRDPRERPPLGARFSITDDGKTVVVAQVRRGAPYVARLALDGTDDVREEGDTVRTHRGRLDGESLWMSTRVDAPGSGKRVVTVTEFTLTPTPEGLLVRMRIREPVELERAALYRRAPDVPAVKPASGDLGALAWLVGRFTGTQGDAGIEEHWGPAGGRAMLGTARTVAGGKMTSFEFLRILERDGGLVYVAQPGGGPPVEFVLTEVSATRALFENPAHDYPKRIVYERVGEDGLTTEISDSGGARAHRASYRRVK